MRPPEPRAADVVQPAVAGYTAVGSLTRTRVVRAGREVLGAEDIAAAFPGPDAAGPLDIAHVAGAPDGTIVVAVYRFDTRERFASALEIWRAGRLLSAFRVPPGSFRGGVGFADGGQLVALVDADGVSARLFTHAGRPAGSVAVTTW